MGLEASPHGCQEASLFSREVYIPCNAPAEWWVWSEKDQTEYRMCPGCADHSVRRRRMELRGSYDPSVLS